MHVVMYIHTNMGVFLSMNASKHVFTNKNKIRFVCYLRIILFHKISMAVSRSLFVRSEWIKTDQIGIIDRS